MRPTDASQTEDFTALARRIVDANLYMVLGTADSEGRPWASPVYFAHAHYREFVWVSKPGAVHSQNIAVRPEISIVVFDSQVPIGTGQGVYMSAVAEQLTGDEREPAIEVFSQRSLAHGGGPFTVADVDDASRLRLYRAVASEQFALDANDFRVPVTL
jgi:pyridoxamine 5'-phosphate oxidase-like protein